MVKNDIYKEYIADTMYYRGRGQVLTVKYSDVFNQGSVDNRNADDIARDIIDRHGLKYTGDV